jgi:hypothetical protein
LFLDKEVTPAFPDGLTWLEGHGQWMGGKEDSYVPDRPVPLRGPARQPRAGGDPHRLQRAVRSGVGAARGQRGEGLVLRARQIAAAG